MRVSEFAVRRRVTVLMGVIVVLSLGALSFLHLPVELLPDLGLPSVAVMVRYPAATPSQVEAQVSRPLEQALATMPRVWRVSSSSQTGLGIVTVDFVRGTSAELALLELRGQVEQLRRSLPAGIEAPLIARYDPALIPVMSVGITGFADAAEVRERVDAAARERLERLPGVAFVGVTGGSELEVAIEVNPLALAEAGISWTQLRVALSSLAINLPAGHILEMGREVVVRSVDRPEELDDLRNLVVGLRYAQVGEETHPVPIRLGELAQVAIKPAAGRTTAGINGKEGVVLSVHLTAGADAAQVVELVLAELPALRPLLPPGLTFDITLNRAEFTVQSTQQVLHAGLMAATGAAVMLLVSLLSVGSALVAVATVALALAATLGLLYALGLSLNLMTLGGLALAVGLVAGNAIWVIGAIRHRLAEGELQPEAAAAGAAGALAPVVICTLTGLAGLAAVGLAPGVTGVLFRQLVMSTGLALLVSVLVGVTFVPAAATVLLRPRADNGAGPPRRGGQLPGRAYGTLLAWTINNRWQVALLLLLCATLTYQAVIRTGGEFAPRLDRGEFVITVQMPPGTSFERTDEVVRAIAALAAAMPEARYVTSATGSAGPLALGAGAELATADMGSITVKLSKADDRTRSTGEILAELERQIWAPGVRLMIEELTANAASHAPPIEVSVRGPVPATLHRVADDVRRQLAGISGLVDVHVSGPGQRPEIRVHYDRDGLALLGLTPLDVAVQVRGALAGDVVGSFGQGELAGIDVVVRHAASGIGTALEQVRGIRILTPAGTTVRLADIARITQVLEPAAIERQDGQRVLTLTARTAGRDLAAVVAEVRAALARLQLPEGYEVVLGGAGREMEAALAGLARAGLLAIGLIYIILAAHFESVVHPLAILAALPLGALGAAGAMYVTKVPFSVSSAAGLVILIGLVVHAGVVLLDPVVFLRRRGLQREVAISVAGRDRSGAIMAAMLVCVLALLPLVFLPGQGGTLLRPLALVLVGGLVVAMPLTLIVVPAVYLILDDLVTGRWRARRREILDTSDLL